MDWILDYFNIDISTLPLLKLAFKLKSPFSATKLPFFSYASLYTYIQMQSKSLLTCLVARAKASLIYMRTEKLLSWHHRICMCL